MGRGFGRDTLRTILPIFLLFLGPLFWDALGRRFIASDKSQLLPPKENTEMRMIFQYCLGI